MRKSPGHSYSKLVVIPHQRIDNCRRNAQTDQDLQWGYFLCLNIDLSVWATAPSTRKYFYPLSSLSNRAHPITGWHRKANMGCRSGHLVGEGSVERPNLGISLHTWCCKIWTTACDVLGSYYVKMNNISLDSCRRSRYMCIQCPLVWVSDCYD